MRAVAVMIVFVAHCGLQDALPGGFGVTLFFFLSGFLITTLLRREHERTGGISLRRFYLRRAYRIFPPLYLVLGLLAAATLAGLLPYPMTLPAVLAQAFHLTNYYLLAYPAPGYAPVVPFTVPMWSLAVEEHFYLVFPLALLFLLRRMTRRRAALALAAACAAALAWRCLLTALLDDPVNYTYHATDARIDSLLYGCILALALNPALDRAPARVGPRGWTLLCAGALAVLVATFLIPGELFRAALRYTLQGIALMPLFYCAVRYAGTPPFSWLNAWPLRALGLVSYTFYLCHYAAIQLAGRWLGLDGFAQGLGGFVLAAAFSAASYFLMEKRFAALRLRLHR